MNGDKRNYSLSLWDHKDNFLCLLKSSNSDFDGQSFNENLNERITGEKTLSFSIPMYIFDISNSESQDYEKTTEKKYFRQNEAWRHIYNEQKIRYVEYNNETNEPEKIEEFVLKEYTESRNDEEKIAECICESLAVYELGKIGWTVNWDTDYITNYEQENYVEYGDESIYNDLLTIDYWMKKLLYKETNIGRVSTTTECTYLLQGIQLRNEEGEPISDTYSTINGKNDYIIIDEPICSSTTEESFIKYYNPYGWTWEVIANFENDPEKQGVSTLYENPTINKFIEATPNYFIAQSYQKEIGALDNTKTLKKHPIAKSDLDKLTYVTDIKRRLMTTERSNIFSIIQDLCETFEVWASFEYHYNDNGQIDSRKIIFKTESIDEDIKFDFAYGKNLKSCSRILNSNDLITKLYVTNTDSTLVDGNILSIQQATANPTGENYLYNFNYFYECGMLSREEDLGVNSDEYVINLHSGNLRNINNKIINLQKYLAPLYTLQTQLESDLVIQQGSKTGYMDNIQAIEDKIAMIPPDEQLIKSWSADNTQYNHVGESKTFTITTNLDLGGECKYLNFGRDDVLVSDFTSIEYKYDSETGTVNPTGITNQLIGYTPRAFNYNREWHSGDATITDDEMEPYFTSFSTNIGNNCRYDYSEFGDNHFIKGIYFNSNYISINYSRIRYKYAPLAYYYLLIQDYWNKILEVNKKIQEIEDNLTNVKNRILAYDLELKGLLRDKNELILQFERKYKPYIREGYWEPTDYKPHYISKILYTEEIHSNYDGLVVTSTNLTELNLNDSIHNYTKYFILGKVNQINLDSIEMTTEIPIGGVSTQVPRYRGLNYELYRDSDSNLLIAISPELIDKYEIYKYDDSLYKSTVTYNLINSSTTSTVIKNWENIPNGTKVNDYYIYLSDDNILTDQLEVYGGHSLNNSDKLEVYEDYTYRYESAAYDTSGNRVSISTAYSTDVTYDYSLRIDLKLTNKVSDYLIDPNDIKFTVTYGEETTLQYLFNDAVAMGEKYAMPQTQYSISVVDLSSLNEYKDYKPIVGQKVPIWDIEMGLRNFEGFITSVSYPLEEKYNTQIEITTYNTKFEDIFQKLTATVTSINYNENEIYRAAEAFDAATGAIKTDVFQKSLEDNFNRIQLGTNNDITIDKQSGITLRDLDNNNGVKIIGNGIFLTEDISKNDEEITWKTGITGKGINASAITAGNIDTKQINIWNASERQVRFVWNEQGLFAYGDKFWVDGSTTTSVSTMTNEQDLIDYNKYVKFNQEGLDFNDNGRSALKLGWNGLNIQAQNESLELNAEKGLVLQQWNNDHTSVTRLELGKLDDGKLYGLRLKDTSGVATFQSDSRGDLWLHQSINIGGSINSNSVVQNATAGLYGLSTDVPVAMQMGIRRDNNGTIIWDSTPIRFWAGPQTKANYKTNTYITDNDLKTVSGSTNFYGLTDNNSPSLAKFKVSANGDIIASGIDVGGWIGQGTKLRSFDNEAILRSNGYSTTAPVFAIGKPSSNPDITYGSNYNFRVYQDGSINIGNGEFTATSTGAVTARNITISGNSSSITEGTVGGLRITSTGLEYTSGNYTTAVYAIANSTSNAFVAGPTNAPTFMVNGNGKVTCSNIELSSPAGVTSGNFIDVKDNNGTSLFMVSQNGTLTAKSGTIGGWTIDSNNSLYTANGNARTALYPNANNSNAVIYIGTANEPNILNNNTKFKVTGEGSVYFHGGIYGWSSTKSAFRQGYTEGSARSIYTASGQTIDIEICQGLIIDIR